MIMGSDSGAMSQRNTGETWSSWFNQPTGQFYHVQTDNRFFRPTRLVYGATQDQATDNSPHKPKGNTAHLILRIGVPSEAGGGKMAHRARSAGIARAKLPAGRSLARISANEEKVK